MTFENLDSDDQQLLIAAKKAMERAHNPYSNFFVGAALGTADGAIVSAANVENAAYGESICAERCALMKANAEGYGEACIAIAVVARSGDRTTADVTAPCGACRQVIYEFASRSGVKEKFRVLLGTTDLSKVVVTTIGNLLPLAFGPDDVLVPN